MKFILSKGHNFLHWKIVVIIRVICFLIAIPVSVYLIASGLFLFKTAIVLFPLSVFFDRLEYYCLQLPYFAHLILFLNIFNNWYKDIPPEWWAIVIGTPVILIGSSIFLINFVNFFYAIFSPFYNHTHCPFCKQPIKIAGRKTKI